MTGNRRVGAAVQTGPYSPCAPRHPKQKGQLSVSGDLACRDLPDQRIQPAGKTAKFELQGRK